MYFEGERVGKCDLYYFDSGFFKLSLLIVILVDLFHFPKFQFGTEISKKVLEKSRCLKTHNFAIDHDVHTTFISFCSIMKVLLHDTSLSV